MNVRLEQLPVPRYLSADTDPAVTAAFDLYTEVLPVDFVRTSDNRLRSVSGRRALTIYLFNGSSLYVARHEETDAVLAMANFEPYSQLKGHSFVEALVVDESARGQGVGQFVISELMRITKEEGQERLRLRTLEKAFGFYARLGFEPDEIVPVNPVEPYMSIDASLDLSMHNPSRCIVDC